MIGFHLPPITETVASTAHSDCCLGVSNHFPYCKQQALSRVGSTRFKPYPTCIEMKSGWENLMKTTLMAGLMIGAATTVSANDATDLITRFYASVDHPRQSVSDLGRYFSRDITDNDRPRIAPANLPDAAVALNLFAELRSGFPDMRHSLDILAGIADDMAFVYWTFTATHQGDFFGKPATGRAVEIAGVDIFRVADGAFVEQWHVEDLMTLFQQIDFAD